MPVPASELVLNADGSIYHLNLNPEQVGRTIFLVGDPDRVPTVSKHFDRIEHKVHKREFITHTGWLGNKYLSVVSTGIGTDNIDIVLNELDALVNFDLPTRTAKQQLTSLDFIRLGTSGSLQSNIPVDSLVISAIGIGLDNMLHFYKRQTSDKEAALQSSFGHFTRSLGIGLATYVAEGSHRLLERFENGMSKGITLTCSGFYAPQGRRLRAESVLGASFFDSIENFDFEGLKVTNFEMETSGIYGLAKLLGHHAVSCNAILANRLRGEFSKDPKAAVAKLIENVLAKV